MAKWLHENLTYPENASKMRDQGKVFLSFVVEKDGSITNLKVERGISKDLDQEAKRVVSKMPNWMPGESKGRAVRARCRIPINFQLQ
jgi:protein TonB